MRAYADFFEPELSRLGYGGVYALKSRAHTMGDYDRLAVDGCAVFHRRTRFVVRGDHVIEFSRLAMQYGANSEDLLNRVMPKVCLVSLLR